MKFLELPDTKTQCPYISGRKFIAENFLFSAPDADQLDYLLSGGFRHFGAYFFRPVCESCSRCIPLRVIVTDYSPSRSGKRILSKNSMFRVTVGAPGMSRRGFVLYKKHQQRFERKGSESFERYVESFFSPTFGNTQISVFDVNHLISVLHLDVTGTSMSAVYCYFDTAYERRSLGTFTILKGLELALYMNIRWFYLGYVVEENNHMSYKVRYRPNEILAPSGWVPYRVLSGEEQNRRCFDEGFPGTAFRAKHPFRGVFDFSPNVKDG
ncbi:MAG: hypothetical protein CMN78_05250 [Spirochaetales bacterium]|nr:hypothetical protein [Spirochaetales bacterium]